MNHPARTQASYARFDPRRAAIVDQGIALQAAAGTAFAAAFLKAEKINAAIILRVLLRPEQRRRRS